MSTSIDIDRVIEGFYCNTVNFLQSINKRHSIASPVGRSMECLLWIQHLIFCLSSCNFCKTEMSQLGARLTLTFDLEFSMQNCISGMGLQGQIWNLLYRSHEKESKHIDWTIGLKWDHRVWAWIFKVKYGICYISAKWSDCQEKKRKHIDWTPCLKCDHDLERWYVRI